jgi:uncharacterized membrane protein YkoI
MRTDHKLVLGGLIIAAISGTAVYAQQASTQENDALADLSKAQVDITQAIASAQQAANGKAVRAELEMENNTLMYKVEVANASTRKVMDVHVDGVNGKVLSATEDPTDQGRKGETDDD